MIYGIKCISQNFDLHKAGQDGWIKTDRGVERWCGSTERPDRYRDLNTANADKELWSFDTTCIYLVEELEQ